MTYQNQRLIVGDLHLKPTNLHTAEKLFSSLERWIAEHSVSDLIFLGDLYDTKAIIRSEVQNFFLDKLAYLSSLTQVHLIVGNHDYENLDCLAHALTPTRFLQAIKLYDRPTLVPELSAIFMPFMPNRESFLASLAELKLDDKLRYTLYCHQGFRGFDFGNGVLDRDGVLVEDVPSNVFVMAGHYHKHQVKPPIVYVGTPFSHSFGEANQGKVVALQIGEAVSFLSTSANLPQHVRLEVSEANLDSPHLLKTSMQWKDGDFCELTINCKRADVQRYGRDWVLSFIKIVPGSLSIKHQFVDEDKIVRLNENMSHNDMLKRYLETKQQPQLLQLGQQFLHDAALHLSM